MGAIDWAQRAIESEVALSKALGGVAKTNRKYVQIINPYVPWSGDFNRSIGIRVRTLAELDGTIREIEKFHIANKLDPPSRFDFHPCVRVGSAWGSYLKNNRLHPSNAIFFKAVTALQTGDVDFYQPSDDEYMIWYQDLQRKHAFYDAGWFGRLKPLKLEFIKVFKPYWLVQKTDIIGWVYIANFGNYVRLFEVEVAEKYQGQGYGKKLISSIKSEAHQMGAEYLLIQTNENLRPFYEKCGFNECVKNIVLWK